MSKIIGYANQLLRTGLGRLSITHDTRNTTIPCRVCRATRIVTVEHSDGIVRLHTCIACKGTGEVRN